MSWSAPQDNGGATITDYEYRIDGMDPWISTGSAETTYTVSGLANGAEYVFQVRAVNRVGAGRASVRVKATVGAVLNFAHFVNGTGITSDLVFVNPSPQPTRPAVYFHDTGGALVSAESVVEVTEDLEVQEGRRTDGLDGDRATGRTHDCNPWARRAGVGIGAGGHRRPHWRGGAL